VRSLAIQRSLGLVLFAALTLAANTAWSQSIVPPDAKLEKIFDGGLVLTEGVAVAPDGMVYFSDITFTHVSKEKKLPLAAGHIWKFNPKTGKTSIFRSPSGMSNGIKFDAAGNMLVAEGADFGGPAAHQDGHEDRQELHPRGPLRRPAVQLAQ
jgi:gluconolactonase